jgi:hypothetical protein
MQRIFLGGALGSDNGQDLNVGFFKGQTLAGPVMRFIKTWWLKIEISVHFFNLHQLYTLA